MSANTVRVGHRWIDLALASGASPYSVKSCDALAGAGWLTHQ